ncbi:MAG: sigma-70 family RNA polymerase sigma factor [Myxococcota bacterium]
MSDDKNILDFNKLEEICRRHTAQLKRFALYLTRDSEEAADLVQETFAQFLKRPDAYDGSSALSTWLHKIMQYQYYNRLRKPAAQLEESYDPTGGFFDDKGMWDENAAERFQKPFLDALEAKEALEIVEKCLKELPHQQRTAFYLKYIEQMENSEIAKALDVTEGNLRIILHRARFALRTKIAETE